MNDTFLQAISRYWLVLFVFFLLSGCSPKLSNLENEGSKNPATQVVKSYSERIDDAIENAIDYFNKKMLLFTDDQLVMTLSLLNDEFDLNIVMPKPHEFTSLNKKLKDNYFRLYGRYFLNVSEPDVELVSESEFLKATQQFKQERPLRNSAFLLCKDVELPVTAYSEFKKMAKDSLPLYPEWIFHLKNIKEMRCYEQLRDVHDDYDLALNESMELLDNEMSNINLATRLEALAMLSYVRKDSVLTEDNISRLILNTQLENGGWPSTIGNVAVPKPSLMAFWTLLEVRRHLSSNGME